MDNKELRDDLVKSKGFPTWHEYLKSSEWKMKSRKWKAEHKELQACIFCGKDRPQLHHSVYTEQNTIGNFPEFIIPVCDLEHLLIHKIEKRQQIVKLGT